MIRTRQQSTRRYPDHPEVATCEEREIVYEGRLIQIQHIDEVVNDRLLRPLRYCHGATCFLSTPG